MAWPVELEPRQPSAPLRLSNNSERLRKKNERVGRDEAFNGLLWDAW